MLIDNDTSSFWATASRTKTKLVKYYIQVVEEGDFHDLQNVELIDTGSDHNFGESAVEYSWGLIIDGLSL